jgi:hypothetical protein
MESSDSMTVVPMISFGVLFLVGLILGIPLLVILLVNPKSRTVLASIVRFMGWAAGCIALLVLLGYFVAVPSKSTQHDNPQWIQDPNPAATRVTQTTVERTSHDGDLATGQPQAAGLAPIFATVSSVRPDWIEQAPGIQGQKYCMAVKSGLWTTDGECQQAIDGAITKALGEYLASYFGDDRAAQLVAIDPVYLRQQLVKQPLYAETVDASVGTMRQWHALLEFDDDLRAELRRLWQQASVSNRLRDAAGGFALVLAALGTLFAYLKLDLATDGQYRGRLRCASGLAILLVAAGAVGICVL